MAKNNTALPVDALVSNEYLQISTYKTAKRTEEIILILRINDKGVEKQT